MPRQKLAAWEEFVEVPADETSQMKMGRMECKHCKGTVSKSVHRLLSHLRTCPKYEGEVAANDAPNDNVKDEGESAIQYHPLSKYIDHTLLKADATSDDIIKLCEEAHANGFFSVCVNGIYASFAREVLDGMYAPGQPRQGRRVKVCCVVGFPLGASASAVKAFEATQCLNDGAEEIDMVLAVGKMKSGDHAYVLRDICAVVAACKAQRALCKVILETALLTEEEIRVASELAVSAGANFIKTSTGFSTRGASVDDVVAMSRIAHPKHVQVKASGGVRSLDDANKMIQAGATRLGTSSGIAITRGEVVQAGQY
ncbi:Aste57867_8370 [Aphanomyces stellatus]|uniref:deoxyribose-phosphate aldolase n=1 Tax=Aphanomyces stellatus TaxID=120398 RepID=A0A485KK90_9STRA|nr:hypothetical protein As57867_008338 [Aphanomyces stellatus]VFT85256.1 Aste57867_8370 [Aphanomyces stellatus]